MTETSSDIEGQGWIIAPETSFSPSAEDMARRAATNSEVFVKTKAEARAALTIAFTNAEAVFAHILPRLTDLSISTAQLKNDLRRDPMSIGELHGRVGLLASCSKKAKRKAALHGWYDARRALIALKQSHGRTYYGTLRQIETARQDASIGIPRLTNDTRNMLEYLYGLERSQLSEAVSENINHIAQIEAFHEAVRARFGMAHEIFGQTQTALTEEQRVHFEVLKTHEQDIRNAQSLVRNIMLLGGDDDPVELDLDLEQDWNLGR